MNPGLLWDIALLLHPDRDKCRPHFKETLFFLDGQGLRVLVVENRAVKERAPCPDPSRLITPRFVPGGLHPPVPTCDGGR